MKLEKRNESKPIITVTPEELDQKRLQMRAELDDMDFQIAKNKRIRELKKQNSLGVKFKDAMDNIGTALDGFGDMGLKDNYIEGKPKEIKSIDKLASFD